MSNISEGLNTLKTKELKFQDNKAKMAKFAYTQQAYTDDTVNGVEEYNYGAEQNIPIGSPEYIDTNDTVLNKGFRSQASSISRNLMNHFFGRASYNLNKAHDNIYDLISLLYTALGTANGLPTLDENGRIPYSQLPESAIELKGFWDASTNTPHLINGTGTKGDMYICTVEGWFDATTGTGSPTEVEGYQHASINSRVMYSDGIWKVLPSGNVDSVNGLTGSVTLTGSNIQVSPSDSRTMDNYPCVDKVTNLPSQVKDRIYDLYDEVTAYSVCYKKENVVASFSNRGFTVTPLGEFNFIGQGVPYKFYIFGSDSTFLQYTGSGDSTESISVSQHNIQTLYDIYTQQNPSDYSELVIYEGVEESTSCIICKLATGFAELSYYLDTVESIGNTPYYPYTALEYNSTYVKNKRVFMHSEINTLKSEIMLMAHPVGSLYWSSQSTDPATLFGGTWTPIKDKFVWAKGDNDTVNYVGGSKTKTLEIANLPSHTHTFTPDGEISGGAYKFTGSSATTAKSGSHYHFKAISNGNFSSTSTQPSNWTALKTTAGSSDNYAINSAPSTEANVNYDYANAQSYFMNSKGKIIYPFNTKLTKTGGSIGTTYGNCKMCGDDDADDGNGEMVGNTYSNPNKNHAVTSYSGYHDHTVTAKGSVSVTTNPTFNGTTSTSSSVGEGVEFDIMPPYVVKYCWERTA